MATNMIIKALCQSEGDALQRKDPPPASERHIGATGERARSVDKQRSVRLEPPMVSILYIVSSNVDIFGFSLAKMRCTSHPLFTVFQAAFIMSDRCEISQDQQEQVLLFLNCVHTARISLTWSVCRRIADLEGEVELLRSKVGQQQHGRSSQSTSPLAMIESASLGPPEAASLSMPPTIEPWCNTPGVSVTSETQVVAQYQAHDYQPMTALSGLDHAAVYHQALSGEPSLGDAAITSKSIDGIHLTSEQINALFKMCVYPAHNVFPSKVY
jgi:hypothetical protein